ASGSKSARLTTAARSTSGSRSVIAGEPTSGRGSAGELQSGQRREQRLAPDLRVTEGDGDLLVAAGELRADHDAVAPSGVAHPIGRCPRGTRRRRGGSRARSASRRGRTRG